VIFTSSALMNKKKIGFLTIGQSPRQDVLSEIMPLLSPALDAVEYGLLDNLGLEEIDALKPGSQETPLVSCLKDGHQVELSEHRISKLLPHAVKFMKAKMGVKAVGVLCTHEFPKNRYSCPTVFPFDCLKFIINDVLEVRKLGVVVPLENQKEMTKQKWGKERTCVIAKSPYTEGKTWEDVATTFLQEKAEAVVLDCIGYKIRDRHEFQNLLSIPTLLPRTILAFAMIQFF